MKKYEVRFDGGANDQDKAVNFMSASIDGVELFAMTDAIPNDANPDEYGYDDLKAEIIRQAEKKGISADELRFWWDE